MKISYRSYRVLRDVVGDHFRLDDNVRICLNVDYGRDSDQRLKVYVNWAALGERDHISAYRFAERLNEVAQMAGRLSALLIFVTDSMDDLSADDQCFLYDLWDRVLEGSVSIDEFYQAYPEGL